MTTYISAETDEPTPILCRFADRPKMGCSADTTAVALRSQWQGGDPDIDPHWIPVCVTHDETWDRHGEDDDLEERYWLPRFVLPPDTEEKK